MPDNPKPRHDQRELDLQEELARRHRAALLFWGSVRSDLVEDVDDEELEDPYYFEETGPGEIEPESGPGQRPH